MWRGFIICFCKYSVTETALASEKKTEIFTYLGVILRIRCFDVEYTLPVVDKMGSHVTNLRWVVRERYMERIYIVLRAA